MYRTIENSIEVVMVIEEQQKQAVLRCLTRENKKKYGTTDLVRASPSR